MKQNPRKRPASQADVQREFRKGIEVGTRGAITMMVYALVDNEFLEKDEVDLLAQRFKSVAECVAKGNLKMKDLEEILINEYGWEVEMK